MAAASSMPRLALGEVEWRYALTSSATPSGVRLILPSPEATTLNAIILHRETGATSCAQSNRKNDPTGSSLPASIFGTAAASVAANVAPLAPMRRMSSSTGVASAFTPLA